MTYRHTYSWLGSVAVALVFVSGCTTMRSEQFATHFLPPAPRTASASTVPAVPDAPKLESSLFASQSPTFLRNVEASAQSSAATLRIQRANARFEAGRKAYQSGDAEKARSEFDAAVEVLLTAPANMVERSRIEIRLEEMIGAIHRFDVNGLGATDLAGQPGYDKAPLEDILELTFPIDPSWKPRVREQVTATKSGIPLQINDVVLSYINFFQSEKGRHTLLAGFKRAGRYKNLISRILDEEQVPQELIFLAQAESGFLPRAVSHKSAVGMWQFVQARGREYGLMQTSHSDDRLDPEKATRSAARHLRDLYKHFGDWYLAIAAYNCGPGGVERAVERTGYADFWELRSRNAIPRETTNYVPIIVAMTIMAKNAKEYGLENIEVDEALEYEKLTIDTPTHLALLADAAERSLTDLRELNPSLLTNVVPAGYEIRIPKGSSALVTANLAAVPASMRASHRLHRVISGETLATIAKRYNTSERSLANVNSSGSADVGEVLLIPAAPATKTKIVAKRTGTSAVRKKTSGARASTKPATKGSQRQAAQPARRSGKLVATLR